MFTAKSRTFLLPAALLLTAPGAAFADDWKGQFGLNVAGGAGQTGAAFDDGAVSRDVRSMTYGAAELEFGATDMDEEGYATGPNWAVVMRSVSFGPAEWDRHGGMFGEHHDRPDWAGGAMGLRGGYTYGRLETNISFMLGSTQAANDPDRPIDGERRSKMTRTFFQPGIGASVTMYRGQAFDLKLRAAYEPMFFNQALAYHYDDGETATYSDRLNAHHVGLAFTFYPGQSNGSDVNGSVHFFGNCGAACSELLARGLVEIGSAVGRAAAEGVFRALLH